MKSITKETGATPPTQAKKSATVGARRAHSASGKAKSGNKGNPPKKAPRRATKAPIRGGSKTAAILEMLKRPDGVTSEELLQATKWQPHSLRGFLSGTLKKRMGLAITSAKGEDGERRYALKS
jgi:hypothetical protein